MRAKIIIALILLVSVIVLFWRVTGHQFLLYDDSQYIYDNPHVRGGLTVEGIVWAFSSVWSGNWHPLTWLSHMLDVQFFGLNPAGHHLVNVLLHAINTSLLFIVLDRMTGMRWRSAFVAALFAFHPLHVESVAWAAERKDVLSTLFWMLTLYLYARYVERPAPGRFLATLCAFAAGLTAKPMLVTLPMVLLLLDYWPLSRFSAQAGRDHSPNETDPFGTLGWNQTRPLLVEKIPFLLLSAASCIITVHAQKGAVSSLEALPLSFRAVNALISYVRYLANAFCPTDLAIIYPMPDMLSVWPAVGAALLLLGISVAVVKWRHACPCLVVGWLWFLGTLVPVIGLLQVGVQAMADRYTYIPSIGIFLMVAWGVPEITVRLPQRKAVLGVFAGAVLAVLAFLTYRQLSYWRDSVTLFSHAVEVTPPNAIAHKNLALALDRQGNLAEAVNHYRKALEINPYDARTHHNIGFILVKMGMLDEAIQHLTEAVRLDPDFKEARDALDSCLWAKGLAKNKIPLHKEGN